MSPRVFWYLVPAFILIISQAALLDSSQRIALHYAPTYHPPSTEQVKRELIAQGVSAPSEDVVILQKALHDQQNYEDNVEPIKENFESTINVLFSVAYLILLVLAIRALYRWWRSDGVLLLWDLQDKAEESFFGLADKLGLKDVLYNYKLDRAEKEIARLDSLFEKGLITEFEYGLSKQAVKTKLRNGGAPWE